MGILTGLLQGLSGIVGGVNGTVGIQIIGSATLDMGSTMPAAVVYTPPANNNAHLVALSAVLRMPNGTAVPTATGYPLQVSIRFNGVQAFVIPADGPGMATAASKYVYGEPAAGLPLGTATAITAQMVVPSATSTSAFVDVIGYAVATS